MNVDVVIPAYKPGQKFIRLIGMLSKQTVPVGKIIVMNTEEKWWSDRLVGELKASADKVEVHHLTKAEFDHAGTRNAGIAHSDAEYVILMTDDAIPYDQELVENLLKPFSELLIPRFGQTSAQQLRDLSCRMIVGLVWKEQIE